MILVWAALVSPRTTERPPMFTVTLATTDSTDRVTCKEIGRVSDKTKAMALAKRTAGRGAEFSRRGESIAYVGPKGAAYVI